MKRRFRQGLELAEVDFHRQGWVRGMLTYHGAALFLCQSNPGHKPPPFGILYRPTLKACALDTISFAGIEQEQGHWMAQVWFCEVGRR